ncbi:LamG-like jellyroll fold domain-containing protein [Crateriforma spongiae]|uniref:LamG-like jellyroll fold domain-containing protein n=1 Tax=Crateriforma spongiae TaxID=2724528 RepID=UPI0014480461|nr:LamG-like jellyroll fold domain-containing protein [Crateriforma spongiae]
MDNHRLNELTLAHLDGCISDSEFAELQQLLESDADARTRYVEMARLDSELRESGGAFDEPASEKSPQLSTWSRMPRVAQTLVIAATVLILLVPTWMMVRPDRPVGNQVGGTTNATPSKPVRSVAVISAEADAVWTAEDGKRIGKGTALEPGMLNLAEGLAQIDFFSGASMTLSGPTVIELRSRNLAVLHRGRVRANVPPAARGFEIQTADVRLEDLGTSFGIVAGDNGQSDVVVFDGEVRAVDREADELSLLAGDTAHLVEGEATMSSSQELGEFPDILAIIERSGDLVQSRYARWKAAATDRRSDPRLIAYYDFENLTDTSRRLANRAVAGSGSELDGGIVGARVADGRWPGKPALDFRGEGDRVRFNIPGEFDAMTLYAWVRIDALDRDLNSLFLTDHFDPGEIHWQLSVHGSLHFATSPIGVPPAPAGFEVAPNEQIQAENRRFWSENFWDASQSGHWFLLATTVDRAKQPSVVHYINGQPVGFNGGSNMDRPLPKLRIGYADLGNWTDPIWAKAIRSLNGRIDEFAIYSAALEANEIRTIYMQGRP